MPEALYAAVTLAKSEQIRTLPALRSRLDQQGFTAQEIDEAFKMWADYVARTH